MISLEQVQLLEERVSRAVEYAQKITAENKALIAQREELEAKLEANQKRIDELEVLIMSFKEDQGRIEDGIIAALDRLSQFEEAFQNSLKDTPKKPVQKPKETSASKEIYFEVSEAEDTEDEVQQDDIVSEGELDIF